MNSDSLSSGLQTLPVLATSVEMAGRTHLLQLATGVTVTPMIVQLVATGSIAQVNLGQARSMAARPLNEQPTVLVSSYSQTSTSLALLLSEFESAQI